ncbi:putative thioredoxin [Microthyrium microscopicum]|uniref:Glutathione S-transferase kappa 1 n=1 Tax=Microthyrium microscopicum TaxID=703497 RepID=A0A6A6U315_9PEZI|nr:putative thioredoxin [Microthyrium microscopicum]
MKSRTTRYPDLFPNNNVGFVISLLNTTYGPLDTLDQSSFIMAETSKIELFYDTVSPYSWYALHYLQKNREALSSHGINIELTPVFLGGIMQKSGNTPPWKNTNKATMGTIDKARAQKYFGLEFGTPDFFPAFTLLPQRSLTYIKDKYPPAKLEEASVECWKMMWMENKDITKPELMIECLARHFDEADIRAIMQAANSPEYKSKLLASTDRALETGAYGCPWFEVTNHKGVKEPFFGSDRFHYMWEFLELPWQDIAIMPKSKI